MKVLIRNLNFESLRTLWSAHFVCVLDQTRQLNNSISTTMAFSVSMNKNFLRSCIFYDFKVGLKAVDCHRRLCKAFGYDVISDTTTRDWFRKFKAGEIDLQDKPRSGRPSSVDDERLMKLLEADPRSSDNT